jgi:hypothetical protein
VVLLQGDDLGSCGPDDNKAAKNHLLALVERWYPNFVKLARAGHATSAKTAIEQPLKESAEFNKKWQAKVAAEMLEKMKPEAKARYDAIDPEVRQAFVDGLFNPWRVEMATVNPGYYENILDLNSDMVKNATAYMAGYLQHIRAAATLEGAGTIALSIPYGCYVNCQVWDGNHRCGFTGGENLLTSDALDAPLRDACGRADMPFFATATSGFRTHEKDTGLFFPLDGHLTPAGHSLYAECVTPVFAKVVAEMSGKK